MAKDDRPQGTETVKLEPQEWAWTCLVCDTYNVEMDTDEIVTCNRDDCRTSFFTQFHNNPDS